MNFTMNNRFAELSESDAMNTSGGEVIIAVVGALIAAGTAIGVASAKSRKNRS